jgi:hypothetical protein
MRPSQRRVRRVLFAALLLLLPFTAPFIRGRPGVEATESPNRPPADKRTAPVMEARFLDDSALRLVVRDERIELVTPYGKLLIPVRDIQKIEVGFRVPADVARRIDAALADLGHAEFERREAASAELLELRDYAYPALEKAAKSSDAEVARRARELVEKIREDVPEDRLVFHPHDVVYTADSKNTGRLTAATIKVHTSQFGEQQLKLSDVRQLRSPSAIEEVAQEALPDPGHMSSFLGQVGKVYRFHVTGAVGGFIYGTDVYTLDSTLAVAAVHAGILKVGQSGIVRVKILAGQPVYNASTRHGVTSQAYGAYSGSYQFVRGRGRGR